MIAIDVPGLDPVRMKNYGLDREKGRSRGRGQQQTLFLDLHLLCLDSTSYRFWWKLGFLVFGNSNVGSTRVPLETLDITHPMETGNRSERIEVMHCVHFVQEVKAEEAPREGTMIILQLR